MAVVGSGMRFLLTFSCLAFGASLTACRSTTGVSTVCAPQERIACACTTGTTGVQTCNAEGTAFGVCDCGNGTSSSGGGSGSSVMGSSSVGSSSSSSSSSSGGNALEMQIAQVCQALAQAQCGGGCGQAEGCEAGVMYLCRDFYGPLTRRKVEQGFLTWNAANVPGCVANPGTQVCGRSFELSAACQGIMFPARTLGQTCYDAISELNPDTCAQGFCPGGHGMTGPCPSTCVAFRLAGETCAEGQRCTPGAQCSNGMCTVPGQLGGTCTAGCAEGLFCTSLSDGGTRCEPLLTNGSACPYGPACLSQLCENNLCVATTTVGGQCTENAHCPVGASCRFMPDGTGVMRVCSAGVGAGAPCVGDESCTTGMVCLNYTPPNPGTCTVVTPGNVGQPCFNGSVCATGLYCNNAQTCASRAGLGGACSPDSSNPLFGACSAGLYCSSANTCAAAVAPGGTCTEHAACQGRHYCGPANTCIPRKAWGQPCSALEECFSDWCEGTCVGFCTP
jgi:hypothetical protein